MQACCSFELGERLLEGLIRAVRHDTSNGAPSSVIEVTFRKSRRAHPCRALWAPLESEPVFMPAYDCWQTGGIASLSNHRFCLNRFTIVRLLDA